VCGYVERQSKFVFSGPYMGGKIHNAPIIWVIEVAFFPPDAVVEKCELTIFDVDHFPWKKHSIAYVLDFSITPPYLGGK
jgi:hypothetical protein